MKRRDLLKYLPAITVAAVLIPRTSTAEEIQPQVDDLPECEIPVDKTKILLNIEIDRNHGHELVLNAQEALKALQLTKNAELPLFFDIEGKAGHSHAVELSHLDLMSLWTDGVLTKKTSINAGHQHTINLVIGR